MEFVGEAVIGGLGDVRRCENIYKSLWVTEKDNDELLTHITAS